jgi:hypothetical protein
MCTPAIHAAIGEDSPRARRSDPETSHEAADSNDLNGSQAWVLHLIRTYGPLDDVTLCDEHEVALDRNDDVTPWTDQRIRSARHELVERGLVEWAGIWKIRPGHRRARVWQAVK